MKPRIAPRIAVHHDQPVPVLSYEFAIERAWIAPHGAKREIETAFPFTRISRWIKPEGHRDVWNMTEHLTRAEALIVVDKDELALFRRTSSVRLDEEDEQC